MTIQTRLSPRDFEREGARTAFEGPQGGALDFSTDEDYFLFAAEPGRSYRIAADSGTDLQLGLYSTPSLDLLFRNDDGGPGLNPEIVFDTEATPELFVIQVDAFGAPEPGGAISAGLGDYVLEIEDLGSVPIDATGDVVGNTRASAGGIVPSQPRDGEIEVAGDLDRYAIYVEEGRTYTAELRATDTRFDPFLEVIDETDTLFAENDDANEGTLDSRILFEAQATGFYTLQASDFDLQSGTGNYEIGYFPTGVPADPGGDTVGDRIATASLAEIEQPVVNRIDSRSDVDVYEFSLTVGNTYLLDLLGIGGFDPTLTLRDASGRQLAFNDDRNPDTLDSAITFTPGETAFYYAEVEGFRDDVGAYDLLVDLRDSVAATTTEAQSIALLYEAGLGRQAAFTGLNFWIDRFEDGNSLTRIAQSFIDSPEFFQRVGDPLLLTDREFVEGLFINVIGRPGAEAGIDFWTGRLAAPGVGQDDVLLAFAVAPENAAQSPEVRNIVPVGDIDDTDPDLRADPQPEWDFA